MALSSHSSTGRQPGFTLRNTIISIFLLLILCVSITQAQQCSKTKTCATGCCSQHGYCGTTSEHCGTGCQSTCNWKPPTTECSKTKLCKTGCCSAFGFCGESAEHCGKDCLSTCDWKPPATECDANKPCQQGCCSKFGHCGFGKDFCSKENCVNNCDRKADCDPGTYGKDFVKFQKCPLNVCCSKHGFCGTTKEFCGIKEPDRPKCTVDDKGLSRVVGYYEGWAPNRRCHAFYPEQIPRGVYTHLNFAFATINPKTLEIQPTDKSDIEFYQRLNTLKLADPGLRTYIAVGGWTFNDPGPTRTTFSDIARNTANMDKFIKSVIKFLQKYDFDGIDLDWEYPVADDRGGRAEDFKNFVTLSKRLKQALKTTTRTGYSITLPASFWYLQNFDIKALEPHVDFFNIMSYDLHGTWDMPNQWTGPYLNAHTNLTELRDSMDLFWRNDISPSKIVFGTGFYGRAFTVSDPTCKSPGCRYASGAPSQKCSREISVILNNEIMDIIEETGAKPVLHKKEAVKSLSWGNNWVAYDDEETLSMRADFVREQCLGGIMVWAVSHDTPDGRFSKAVKKAANRAEALSSTTDGYEKVLQVHDQCKWTNCLEGCPSGWHYMPRTDSGRRPSEPMINQQGCEGYGQRYLCCPPGAAGWDGPSCGWWGHNNGRCNHRDHDSAPIFEIGSNNQHCKKKNSYQIAGCSWSSDAVKAHNACSWSSEFPKCGAGSCEAGKSELFDSSTGSQGAFCKGNSRRKYCCWDNQKDIHWENCAWYDRAGNIPNGLGSKTCIGGCPSGMTPLALDHKGGSCKKGARARCCDVGYKTVKRSYNNKDEEFNFYLTAFLRRDAECVPESSEDGTAYRTQEYIVSKVHKIIYGTADQSTKDVWEAQIGLRYSHLSIGEIQKFAQSNSVAKRLGSSGFPKRLVCGLTTFNNLIGGKSSFRCTCYGPNCCISKLCERDNDARQQRRGEESHELVESWLRESHGNQQGDHADMISDMELVSAESDDGILTPFGDRRPFPINVDDPYGVTFAFVIFALRYYNIGAIPFGNDLWQRGWTYSSQGCWDYDVTPINTLTRRIAQSYANFVVEHIIELQTIAQFIRSTITGVMRSGARFEDTVDGRIWEQLARNPYPLAIPALNGKRMPLDRMFSTLGTRTNLVNLVLVPKTFNDIKESVWRGDTPIKHSVLTKHLEEGTSASFEAFLNEIRHPLVVLQYLASADVRRQARVTYRALRAEMALLSREARANGYRNPDLEHMLDRWFRDHIDTMIRETRTFMRRYFDLGRAAIQGSGVQGEQELLGDLLSLWNGAADFQFDYEGWFSDNPTNPDDP